MIVSFALALVSATPTVAATPSRMPDSAPATSARTPIARANYERTLDAAFSKVDTNSDGTLTQAELDAAVARAAAERSTAIDRQRQSLFAILDKNKDSYVSRAEFLALPVPAAPNPDVAAAVSRLDANHDGKLSASEYKAPAIANFNALDRNHDGSLGLDEQRPSTKKSN